MAQSPDTVVRQWFKEVWDEGRDDAVDRLFDPALNPDQIKAFIRKLRGSLSNIKVEVLRTVVQGDTVVAQCRLTGLHTGDAFGVAATGRPVELTGMSLVTVLNGRIKDCSNSYDFGPFYQQLGLMANPPLPPLP
jgi:predicted ester cyclase